MKQRDTIPLPPVSVSPQNKRVVSHAISLSLVRFFLEGFNTDVDILFLDVNGVNTAIREGREYAAKLAATDNAFAKLKASDTLTGGEEELVGNQDIPSAVDGFCRSTKDRAGALVLTFANGNVLTIVGSSSNYYLFDVVNRIFVSMEHPLYDIMNYRDELGDSGEFTFSQWMLKGRDEEDAKKKPVPPPPIVVEEVVATDEPQTAAEPKKKKPRTVRKKTEEVTPIEIETKN